MIAKLVCSRHKPGQQTLISDDSIPQIFKYTPIRDVRNLGGKLGRALMEKFDIKVKLAFESFVSTVCAKETSKQKERYYAS